MKKELHRASLRARSAFARFEGVVGVGYGPKLKGGKVVAPYAVVVFVGRKVPAAQVPSGQRIPPEFDGFPTDVREPRLSLPVREDFDPSEPPEDKNDLCLVDYQWIDWAKIHASWRRQQQEGSESSTPGGGDVA